MKRFEASEKIVFPIDKRQRIFVSPSNHSVKPSHLAPFRRKRVPFTIVVVGRFGKRGVHDVLTRIRYRLNIIRNPLTTCAHPWTYFPATCCVGRKEKKEKSEKTNFPLPPLVETTTVRARRTKRWYKPHERRTTAAVERPYTAMPYCKLKRHGRIVPCEPFVRRSKNQALLSCTSVHTFCRQWGMGVLDNIYTRALTDMKRNRRRKKTHTHTQTRGAKV